MVYFEILEMQNHNVESTTLGINSQLPAYFHIVTSCFCPLTHHFSAFCLYLSPHTTGG